MANGLKKYYDELLVKTSSIATEALSQDDISPIGDTHLFIDEMEIWKKMLSPRTEVVLISYLMEELQYSTLSIVSGLYRHAFVGLRMVLELGLAMVFFASHRLYLAEWQQGRRDTSWKELSNDDDGVLSTRYADAFCTILRDDTSAMSKEARRTYRKLSAYVHGNIQTWDRTPINLKYDSELFTMWFTQFKSVTRTLSFAWTLRYVDEMTQESKSSLSESVLSRIGDISNVRELFGGAVEKLNA